MYKLEKTSEHSDEVRSFLDQLRESQDSFKSLYHTQVTHHYIILQEDFHDFSARKNYLADEDPTDANIFTHKDYSQTLQGNPWLRRISQDELSLLFFFFKYCSYFVDYLRGIPVRYDRKGNWEAPVTNLRFLSNYYNLASASVFVLVLYFLVRVTVSLLFK